MSVKLMTVVVLAGAFGMTGLPDGAHPEPRVVPRYVHDVDFLAGSRWMPAPVQSVGRLVTSGAVTAEAVRIARPVAGLPLEVQWEVVAASCELADQQASGVAARALSWPSARYARIRAYDVQLGEVLASLRKAGALGDVRTVLGRAALCRDADSMTADID